MPDEFIAAALPRRSIATSMRRGARLRCPSCGIGRLFRAYLKVADHCPHCREALYHHRADDAPPYITILIVGHVIVPLTLVVERLWQPAYWVHVALWLPLTLVIALTFLPISKGAIVGLQWALYMHGFNPQQEDAPHIDPVWTNTQ